MSALELERACARARWSGLNPGPVVHKLKIQKSPGSTLI